MLVVVKNRDVHALAEFFFDDEAFRGADIFQIDGTEGRLKRRDHFNQLVGIKLVHFDVEAVDVGEFFE